MVRSNSGAWKAVRELRAENEKLRAELAMLRGIRPSQDFSVATAGDGAVEIRLANGVTITGYPGLADDGSAVWHQSGEASYELRRTDGLVVARARWKLPAKAGS